MGRERCRKWLLDGGCGMGAAPGESGGSWLGRCGFWIMSGKVDVMMRTVLVDERWHCFEILLLTIASVCVSDRAIRVAKGLSRSRKTSTSGGSALQRTKPYGASISAVRFPSIGNCVVLSTWP